MLRGLRRFGLSMGLLVGIGAAPPTTLAASDLYPDLGMGRLTDIRIDNTSTGRRLLRFTTVIANVGSGPFRVHGTRLSTETTTMPAVQCVFDDLGACNDVTPNHEGATLEWSGDLHNHWHVRDLESYELRRLDNGVLEGTGAKTGFCFYDNTKYRLTLEGAPVSPVYTNCGRSYDLEVTMGLSVGWADTYYWSLAYQWIDITGLAAGRYRLLATADPSDWFVETNESNNTTWVDLQIRGKGGSVKVLAYGPSA